MQDPRKDEPEDYSSKKVPEQASTTTSGAQVVGSTTGDAQGSGRDMVEGNVGAQGEIHKRAFGLKPPDELEGQMNESAWTGEPDSLLGPPGPKPWANLLVFFFWDRCRGMQNLLCLLWSVVNYHLGKLDGDFFGGSDASSDAGMVDKVLAMGSSAMQWVFLLDIIGVMLQFWTLKGKPVYSIQYMFFARVHSYLHNGKPPFVPVDTKSGTCQAIVVALITLALGVIFRIILEAGNGTRADTALAGIAIAYYNAAYLLSASARSVCAVRSIWSSRIAEGSTPPPPQEWNGVKVLYYSMGLNGPRFDYINGNLYVKTDWQRLVLKESKYQKNDYSPLASMSHIFAGFFAMLFTFHYSHLSLVLSFSVWIFFIVGVGIMLTGGVMIPKMNKAYARYLDEFPNADRDENEVVNV